MEHGRQDKQRHNVLWHTPEGTPHHKTGPIRKDAFLEQCNIASFTISREPSQYRVLCNIANMTDLTAETALENGPAACRRAPHIAPPPGMPFYKSILRHDCWSHLDGFGLTPLRWRAVGPERQRVSACMAMASPPTPYNFPQ